MALGGFTASSHIRPNFVQVPSASTLGGWLDKKQLLTSYSTPTHSTALLQDAHETAADTFRLYLLSLSPEGAVMHCDTLGWPKIYGVSNPISLLQVDDDELLVGGRFGLLAFRRDATGRYGRHRLLVPDVGVSGLLLDRERILWIGTLRSGLLRVPNIALRCQQLPSKGRLKDLALLSGDRGLLATTDLAELLHVKVDGDVAKLPSTRRYQDHLWRSDRGWPMLGLTMVDPTRSPPPALRIDLPLVKAGLVLPADSATVLATANELLCVPRPPTPPYPLLEGRAYDVSPGRAGKDFWAAHYTGLYHFTSITSAPNRVPLPQNSTATALATCRGYVLVGMSNGELYRLDLGADAGGQLQRVAAYPVNGQIEQLQAVGDTLWVPDDDLAHRCSGLDRGPRLRAP